MVVFIRLSTSAVNGASGNVTCSSIGATSIDLATGTAVISTQDDATFTYAESSYCTDGIDPIPTFTNPSGTFSASSSLTAH